MKRRLILSLLMCGLLFSCNGRNNSNNEENLDNEPANSSSFEVDEQGLAFYPLDDGTYGVGIGNAIYLSNIIIPSTHNGRYVTKIIKHGFGGDFIVGDYDPIVKTITLPETITEIEECGFEYLQHLESIKLPKSLKKICDYGIDGISSLKEIQYNGTADEFNQIEFGKEWLETEYYNEGVELSFVFKDITLALNSIFDQLVLFNNAYVGEDTKVIEVIDIQFRDTSYKTVYCFAKTSIFGNLYKRAKNTTMTIEDSTIVEEQEISDSEWAKGFSFRLRSKGVIGSTKVNFAYENLTTAITFTATPDISITVTQALQKVAEYVTDRNKYYSEQGYYYCLEGYVSNSSYIRYDSYNSFYYYECYLKDNLDSDSSICAYPIISSAEIAAGAKIFMKGLTFRSSDYDANYYYIGSSYPITLL